MKNRQKICSSGGFSFLSVIARKPDRADEAISAYRAKSRWKMSIMNVRLLRRTNAPRNDIKFLFFLI
jgi:hypothetical protein